MQQSPSVSSEQELSPITTSSDSSEISLSRSQRVEEKSVWRNEKWYRMTKRMVRFFRFMKIPILRLRFIDMMNRISKDELEMEELKNYETKKVQEDFAFLDDIKRYHEVFNSFSSVGFVWQDREFRLAKLKANYIYEHYMSTFEALDKTNIPMDTIPSISNRMNSPRIFPSLVYLNLFNDAEKFIIEKLLMIYLRTGWTSVSILREKQSTPISNRNRGNRIHEESIAPIEQVKAMKNEEKLKSDHSKTKLKKETQYDEIIIPNWTYSTGLGVVYNPIREKSLRITKRNPQKKTQVVDPTAHSTIRLNDNTLIERKPFDSTSPRPSKHSCVTARPPFKLDYSFSSPYSRCDHIFHKNMFDKRPNQRDTFICQTHSSSWSGFNRPSIHPNSSYRMAVRPQATHLISKALLSCHRDQFVPRIIP